MSSYLIKQVFLWDDDVNNRFYESINGKLNVYQFCYIFPGNVLYSGSTQDCTLFYNKGEHTIACPFTNNRLRNVDKEFIITLLLNNGFKQILGVARDTGKYYIYNKSRDSLIIRLKGHDYIVDLDKYQSFYDSLLVNHDNDKELNRLIDGYLNA
jgi:hypothetical protein